MDKDVIKGFVGRRARVAFATALCLGAMAQTTMLTGASGPVITKAPFTVMDGGIVVTWTADAVVQEVGSGNPPLAVVSCSGVQTAGVTTKGPGLAKGIGVNCWLTADGGVTVPVAAKSIGSVGTSTQAVTTAVSGMPMGVPTQIPPGSYQLCGLVFYWDALDNFHTVDGGPCSASIQI